MNTVLDQMIVGKNTILFFDKDVPIKPFNSIVIDNEIYKAYLPNDLTNAIAIEKEKDCIGKSFSFALIYD